MLTEAELQGFDDDGFLILPGLIHGEKLERYVSLLRDLVARDLVDAGQVKLFYQELTDIIRRYIENRFGLHAPEETTEEFLSELGRTDVLPPRHKALLQQFLQHADLVKFAELKPGTADIQKTFDSGKAFIEDTRADRAVTAQAGSNT